jgi:hypothetical protein
MQCIYLESAGFTLFSIIELKKSQGSSTPGVDKKAFLSLNEAIKKEQNKKIKNSKSKYSLSKKSVALKKEVPQKLELSESELLEIEQRVEAYNESLINSLFKKCLLKTINKNYKAKLVRRV